MSCVMVEREMIAQTSSKLVRSKESRTGERITKHVKAEVRHSGRGPHDTISSDIIVSTTSVYIDEACPPSTVHFCTLVTLL